MHWDGTVSLGNVLTIIAFVIAVWGAASRTYYSLDKRAAIFEKTVIDHAKLLDDHADRMEKQDEILMKIMGEMNRIMGRLDGLYRLGISRTNEKSPES